MESPVKPAKRSKGWIVREVISHEGKRDRQIGLGDDLLAGSSRDHWLLKLERLIDWPTFGLLSGSLLGLTLPDAAPDKTALVRFGSA